MSFVLRTVPAGLSLLVALAPSGTARGADVPPPPTDAPQAVPPELPDARPSWMHLVAGLEAAGSTSRYARLAASVDVAFRVDDVAEAGLGALFGITRPPDDVGAAGDGVVLGVRGLASFGNRQGNRLAFYVRPGIDFVFDDDRLQTLFLASQLGLDVRWDIIDRTHDQRGHVGLRGFVEPALPVAGATPRSAEMLFGLLLYLDLGHEKYSLDAGAPDSSLVRRIHQLLLVTLSDVALGDDVVNRCRLAVSSGDKKMRAVDPDSDCAEALTGAVSPGTCTTVMMVQLDLKGTTLSAKWPDSTNVVVKDASGEDWPAVTICNTSPTARDVVLEASIPAGNADDWYEVVAVRYDSMIPGVAPTDVKVCNTKKALARGQCCLQYAQSSDQPQDFAVEPNVSYLRVQAPWYAGVELKVRDHDVGPLARPMWTKPTRVPLPVRATGNSTVTATPRVTGAPVVVCAAP